MPDTIKNAVASLRKPLLTAFGIFPLGRDLSWIENSPGGGGGGGGAPVHQDLSASLNGSQQNFTLTATPSNSDNVLVIWNGLEMRRGDPNGFTLTGTALHTNFVGQVGDYLVVKIWT